VIGGDYLKKFCLMTLALLMIFTCSALAVPKNTVGFVIVGGSEYKTSDYYKMVSSVFKGKKNITLKVSDEMQSQYQKYLLEYDLIGETVPRKQNLVDFTARSSCNEVVFLFVTATTDRQNNPKSRQKNRLTVQVDAYRCDGFKVLDVQTTSQESNSKTSELRARREAFQKCLKQLENII